MQFCSKALTTAAGVTAAVVAYTAPVLLFLPTAYADECLDKATSQAAMNACAEKAYAASDAALNKLYRQIQQRLNDNGANKRLVAAQRAWVAFRDAECRFSASDNGGGSQGSVFPMVFNLCLDRLTRKRVEDFKSYLSCGDKGDVSCPGPAGK
jgi:uncharacterized protein YecT (DUF1311 family)